MTTITNLINGYTVKTLLVIAALLILFFAILINELSREQNK